MRPALILCYAAGTNIVLCGQLFSVFEIIFHFRLGRCRNNPTKMAKGKHPYPGCSVKGGLNECAKFVPNRPAFSRF